MLFRSQLTEPVLFKIGMHLVPQYKMLLKMKLAEMGIEGVIGVDLNGKPYIHPIYKEIRETIKCVNATWALLGLDEFFEDAEESKKKVIKTKQQALALPVSVQ